MTMQRLIRHGERRTFDTGVLREGGNCRSVLYALGVLLVCLLGSYLFLFRLEHVRVLQEREKARYVVDSYATKIQYVVANAFSSAYLVEALLRAGEGPDLGVLFLRRRVGEDAPEHHQHQSGPRRRRYQSISV